MAAILARKSLLALRSRQLATCSLNEKELGATVSKLVCNFVSDKHYSLARPLKFAVGYNRRGYEETEAKKLHFGSSKSSNSSTLFDRNTCFSVVGSAINGVVVHSFVDLKSPEISVFVELLPLSGVPNGSFVVGVSVLQHSLVRTKPRLSVKSLVSTFKQKQKRETKKSLCSLHCLFTAKVFGSFIKNMETVQGFSL